jgi:hypothetical protein
MPARRGTDSSRDRRRTARPPDREPADRRLPVDLAAVATSIEDLEQEIDREAARDATLSRSPLEGVLPPRQHGGDLPVLRGILHARGWPRL